MGTSHSLLCLDGSTRAFELQHRLGQIYIVGLVAMPVGFEIAFEADCVLGRNRVWPYIGLVQAGIDE